jgi:hypothetical protein
VVGAGIILSRGDIFFTCACLKRFSDCACVFACSVAHHASPRLLLRRKNGKSLGVAFRGARLPLIPTIGLHRHAFAGHRSGSLIHL